MPSLILMHGLPATGKTTIAATIAEDLNAKVLSSDSIRDDVFPDQIEIPLIEGPKAHLEAVYAALESNPSKHYNLQRIFRPFRERGLTIRPDWDERTYTQREEVFERLVEEAEAQLRNGVNVIIDATNIERGIRERYRRIAIRVDCPLYIVSVQSDVEAVRERIARRQAIDEPTTQASTMAIYHGLKERNQPPHPDEASLIVYDSSRNEILSPLHSIDTTYNRIIAALQRVQCKFTPPKRC